MPFSPKESNSKFHALRIPCISLKEYLERIANYSGCSSECLVLALVYIDRIIQSSQHFVVNSYCVHRLLITSIMSAAKFFDDHYYNNAYYAKVGGVAPSEMNALEVEFLFMLNFDLFVTTETYKQYYDELWNHANNAASHLCGCNHAKVPLLILPRFDEPRNLSTLFQVDLTFLDQSNLDCSEENDDDSPSIAPPKTEPEPELEPELEPSLSIQKCDIKLNSPLKKLKIESALGLSIQSKRGSVTNPFHVHSSSSSKLKWDNNNHSNLKSLISEQKNSFQIPYEQLNVEVQKEKEKDEGLVDTITDSSSNHYIQYSSLWPWDSNLQINNALNFRTSPITKTPTAITEVTMADLTTFSPTEKVIEENTKSKIKENKDTEISTTNVHKLPSNPSIRDKQKGTRHNMRDNRNSYYIHSNNNRFHRNNNLHYSSLNLKRKVTGNQEDTNIWQALPVY